MKRKFSWDVLLYIILVVFVFAVIKTIFYIVTILTIASLLFISIKIYQLFHRRNKQ
jgi:hypothetical protein